jgi:hypothetical protein
LICHWQFLLYLTGLILLLHWLAAAINGTIAGLSDNELRAALLARVSFSGFVRHFYTTFVLEISYNYRPSAKAGQHLSGNLGANPTENSINIVSVTVAQMSS